MKAEQQLTGGMHRTFEEQGRIYSVFPPLKRRFGSKEGTFNIRILFVFDVIQ